MLEMVIAVIGALTGLGSLWFTERQWRKINKKIAMLTDANAASEVLPAQQKGSVSNCFMRRNEC